MPRETNVGVRHNIKTDNTSFEVCGSVQIIGKSINK